MNLMCAAPPSAVTASRNSRAWKNRIMDAEQRRHAEYNLRIRDGLVKAMDRRKDVFQVVEDSEDPDEAIRHLMELLELDEMSCRVILDTQLRRFTRQQRQAIAAQAEELRSILSSGGEPQRVDHSPWLPGTNGRPDFVFQAAILVQSRLRCGVHYGCLNGGPRRGCSGGEISGGLQGNISFTDHEPGDRVDDDFLPGASIR